MTYIEFFDKTVVENVISCLIRVPDRVIMLGDDTDVMRRHGQYYARVFAERGHQVEFLPRSVSRSNLDHAVGVLTQLIETYDDCVFDVTGGGELLLLALGIVYSRYPEKHIQIHKCNLQNNAVYDCDKDGVTIRRDTPQLSVREQIRIHGGDVVYGSVSEEKTYHWDLTEEFRRDAATIWGCCKDDPHAWNVQLGVIAAAEKVGSHSQDGLTTCAHMTAIMEQLKRDDGEYVYEKEIIAALLSEGLLKEYTIGQDQILTISYKNPQVKRCLTKAGQALELRVYLAAKDLQEEDGTPVYNDVETGVLIDWDGQCHDERAEHVFDTENEIDVLMLHNSLPVFVSCKNGRVTADELYKLNTVATRFGGSYAKKVLVASCIPDRGERAKYLRQRIVDMGIILIEKEKLMDDEALRRRLQTILCG